MKLNWAERWVVNNPLRVMQQQVEVKWLKKMMRLAPGATVLEIGCGRGAAARLIRREFKPARIHIQDLDPAMIRHARKYLARVNGEPISLSVGDAVYLPFKSDSADAVFGFGFLHHVPEWNTALAEIRRVLKPGAFYYFEELYPQLYQNFITRHILLHPTHDRFRSRDLKKAFDREGLEIKNVFELKPLGILGVAAKTGAPKTGRP